MRLVKWLRVIAHRLVLLASLTSIALSLWLLSVFAFFEETAEEFTIGLRPAQFYQDLNDEELDETRRKNYEPIFGVAHNSGGTVSATLEALVYGADVIEVDVVSLDGRLYSAHLPPMPFPFIGVRAFRGPALEQIWAAAGRADAIKLDLKESSPEFRELLFAFLERHRGTQQVIVATKNVPTLEALAIRAPWVFRLLSVGDEDILRTLREDPELVALIDGVTIYDPLVTAETAAWLAEQELFVGVWTVNTFDRTSELIGYGVDAITTDNLAIVALLSGQKQGQVRLVRPDQRRPQGSSSPSATPSPQATNSAHANRILVRHTRRSTSTGR